MNNLCAYLRSGVLQNGYEIGKAVVSDLPSPQSLHCLDIECFKSNKCITLHKLPGDLPLPGTALIGDASVQMRQITLCTVSVVRSLLFAREYAIEAFDLLEVVFEKLGTFNALSVGPGEVCFQTEVKANRMTRP